MNCTMSFSTNSVIVPYILGVWTGIERGLGL
uniref:Uncharacterized protein n=1 Tax=Arundo donax TaxID=35708 RepID=A0A0A9AZ72_ARUDO